MSTCADLPETCLLEGVRPHSRLTRFSLVWRWLPRHCIPAAMGEIGVLPLRHAVLSANPALLYLKPIFYIVCFGPSPPAREFWGQNLWAHTLPFSCNLAVESPCPSAHEPPVDPFDSLSLSKYACLSLFFRTRSTVARLFFPAGRYHPSVRSRHGTRLSKPRRVHPTGSSAVNGLEPRGVAVLLSIPPSPVQR